MAATPIGQEGDVPFEVGLLRLRAGWWGKKQSPCRPGSILFRPRLRFRWIPVLTAGSRSGKMKRKGLAGRRKEAHVIQRPVAVGLTLCEKLIVEERTRNVTLVNCFTKLKVREVPSPPLNLAVYASLTDGLGEMTLRLVVVRLDTLEDILVQDKRVAFADPLREVRIGFLLDRQSFPVVSRYQFILLADGELVAQKFLNVILLEE
jgi:hypothetical protein